MRLPNFINQNITKEQLQKTINDLISYCKSITPEGGKGIRVSRSSNSSNISFLGNLDKGKGEEGNETIPISHPFKIGLAGTTISLKGGVVNNMYTIPNTTHTLDHQPTYPAVSLGYTINQDGTLTPTEASLTFQYNAETMGDHVSIYGSSLTIFVFLGKIYIPQNETEYKVEQWITGNFSATALGVQKLVWYL